MSRRTKAKPDESGVLTAEEKILKEVHEAYVQDGAEEEVPLRTVMEALGLKCLVPRKRVNVMLVGNHSAGKSSFINWYIDEDIQKTGVAIETSGFTIVHSGRKKDVWKGDASIEYFEWLDGVDAVGEQVVANIRTEICSSKARQFTSVNFIDSPGLTDGTMEYPYPVAKVIMFFAEHCDLVLVFFDPIGQALVERTMGVVEQLNDTYPDKVSYYCSKADTITDANDRQKVLIQITQNVSGRIKNPHTFDIPTVYLPNDETSAEDIPNNIFQICELIDTTISAAVQNALNNLKTDCEAVRAKLAETQVIDQENKAHNSTRTITHWLSFAVFFMFSLLIPLSLALSKLEIALGLITMLKDAIGDGYGKFLGDFLQSVANVAPIYFTTLEEELKGVGMAIGVLMTYMALSKMVFGFFMPVKPTKSKAELKTMEQYAKRCESLLTKRRAWYREYQEIAINKDS